MKISRTVISNSRRIKITYRMGKERWYGEMTKHNFHKGYGWNQWGSSTENLWKTSETTEGLCRQWMEEYMMN